VSGSTQINTRYGTDKLQVTYAHVGLFDVADKKIWIARKKIGSAPIRLSHARLIVGGTNTSSTADKDRFLCYWYNTPNTGEGYVQGYPIEWSEAHLMVRLDPNWNYLTQQYLSNAESRKVEYNIDQQFAWGQSIYDTYVAAKPKFPLSWHMVGPRAADSMFYVQRYEP